MLYRTMVLQIMYYYYNGSTSHSMPVIWPTLTYTLDFYDASCPNKHCRCTRHLRLPYRCSTHWEACTPDRPCTEAWCLRLQPAEHRGAILNILCSICFLCTWWTLCFTPCLMQRVIFKERIIKVWNAMFSFSLGSVSTSFRWGGHFCHTCIKYFFLLITVQKL